MAVCPTSALYRNTAGIIAVEEKRCIGCRMCSLACPFGAMHFHATKKAAFKCDLCQGEPQCVRVCAPGTLKLVEREATGSVQLRKTTDRLNEQIVTATRA